MILARGKPCSYESTSENHDVSIMSICRMLNKYVGWLFKYVEWLSQLENYRICVGKLRGHFCSCFFLSFFPLHSHFTDSVKYFGGVNYWMVCSLIMKVSWARQGNIKSKTKLNNNKVNKTWHELQGDILTVFLTQYWYVYKILSNVF